MVDPVQSVKGKDLIDAFRMIAGLAQMTMMAMPPIEPHVGCLKKPTI